MVQLLNYRRCHGCGLPSKKVRLLVSLPADIHVCDDCILILADIVATQAVEEARIQFVEKMQDIMREPIEIVAKWKEIRQMQAKALSDSKGE